MPANIMYHLVSIMILSQIIQIRNKGKTFQNFGLPCYICVRQGGPTLYIGVGWKKEWLNPQKQNTVVKSHDYIRS